MVGFMHTKYFSKCDIYSQAGETVICWETHVLINWGILEHGYWSIFNVSDKVLVLKTFMFVFQRESVVSNLCISKAE